LRINYLFLSVPCHINITVFSCLILEPSSASRSHDSSTDKDNSSLLSGSVLAVYIQPHSLIIDIELFNVLTILECTVIG